jgi:serine/threonine protein kinase
MAPEVILGNSYTSAVDMWSFGILCMELAGMHRTVVKCCISFLYLPIFVCLSD